MSTQKRPDWLNDPRISLAKLMGSQLDIVWTHILCSPDGQSTDELEVNTGYKHSSIGARLKDLRDMGKITLSKKKRICRSGKKVEVNIAIGVHDIDDD